MNVPRRADERARIDVLTGFRGIAAYAVLLAHAVDISFNYLPPAVVHFAASRLAYLGMSLFFVLSGFVIYYNYADTFRTFTFAFATYEFIVARFARLYPLYAMSIIASLSYVPPPEFSGGVETALSYLTLTQSWSNRQSVLFEPDWSISTEWFFYFAFIALGLTLIRMRRPILALTVLFFAVPIVINVLSFYMNTVTAALTPVLWHGAPVSAPVWPWLTYYSPFVRIFEFLAGVLVAKVYMSLRESPVRLTRSRAAIMIACAGWCALVLFTSIGQDPLLFNLVPNFIYAPALALLILFASRYESWFSRLLGSRTLVFMGEISFSVYIWGWFVMTIFSPHFTSTEASATASINSVVKIAIILGVTTIIALGSYRLVENPSRKWLRAFLMGPMSRVPGTHLRSPKIELCERVVPASTLAPGCCGFTTVYSCRMVMSVNRETARILIVTIALGLLLHIGSTFLGQRDGNFYALLCFRYPGYWCSVWQLQALCDIFAILAVAAGFWIYNDRRTGASGQ